MGEKRCYGCKNEAPLSVKGCGIFTCLRIVDNLDSGDEMTKPLYYIIDEVSPQQMKDFTKHSKRPEKSRKGCRHDSLEQRSSQWLVGQMITNLLCRRSKGRHDSETASITRVESVVVVNESDIDKKKNKGTCFQSFNKDCEKQSLKPAKHPWKSLSKSVKSLKWSGIFFRSFPETSTSCRGFHAAKSFESSVCSTEYVTPVILGVKFPHPVFKEKIHCKPYTEVSSSRCEEKPQDDVAPQITQPDGATAIDGSCGSFSSFPTDECDESIGGRMENGSEYSSYFDDKPFDEVGAGVEEERINMAMVRPYSFVEIPEANHGGYFFGTIDIENSDTADDEFLRWIRRYGTSGMPEFRIDGLSQLQQFGNLFTGTEI
jgi:hypothetical protein